MAENAQKPTLKIPGTSEPTAPVKTTTVDFKITDAQRYRISATRAATPFEERPYDPDEIVEIEFSDGTRIWTSSRRLCNEVVPPQDRKRGADGGIELPEGLAQDQATRGMVGKILFKTLTFFKIDVAEKGASFFAGQWEERTLGEACEGRGPGLYRCATDGPFALAPVDKADIRSDKPVLLFLHGTASSTGVSFKQLWEPEKIDLRNKLFEQYQGNVLALEHRTLSASPVDNAIELSEALHRVLPQGARLHVISHSRGGLVGELLCRVMAEGRDPFLASELSWFKGKDATGARGDLGKLNTLLKERRFQVERFVRVACPAWGTSLASNRLDIYLSILFNLTSKAPVVGFIPGAATCYDVFSELIMLVAKERSDPSVLPGIEAMVPGTPLVQLLNAPGCTIGGELRVIAGDIEVGGSILSSLSTLLTHPLYLGDNDLVVDTDSMFGGAARAGGAAYVRHQGPQVSHFNYFKNHDSADDLLRTLTRATELDHFEPFDPFDKDKEARPYRRSAEGPKPIVFLLPGFMGTHLALGSDRVWLDTSRIATGMLERLKLTPMPLGASVVKPEEPLWASYGTLINHLSNNFEVVPFPYDWRLSFKEEAARLAGELEKALDRAEKAGVPVSILAHSSGGILAKAVTARHRDLWERICKHPGGRLVMLGTPTSGSYWAAQLLTGRDGTLNQLALLDMEHDIPSLLSIFSAFPGLLELLPKELLEPTRWEELRAADRRRDLWQVPYPVALQEARVLREELDSAELDPKRVRYVAGVAPATPSRVATGRDAEGEGALLFYATSEGDGRAAWKESIPPGVETWYFPASHGDLAGDAETFPALSELLASGSTERVPKVPPVTRGGGEVPLPEDTSPLYTGFERLARSAVGGGVQRRREKAKRKVKVVVAHGSLAFTKNPVMVGHYLGDTIVSGEAYLDRVMDGRLRDRHALDLYPGDDDTAEVFLKPKGQPGGAIIIGLGQVGKLSPGKLMRAVSRGVKAYAISIAENCVPEDTLPKKRGLAALLVGTNAGGVSVEDSVKAILRGVDDALHSLEEQHLDGKVAIEELEFLELYEDRAIHAVHAVDRARTDPEVARRFDIDPSLSLSTLTGGLRRASFAEEDSWWQRLEILESSAGNLSFNLLTDRARSQVYLKQNQRVSADRFIAEIKNSSSITSREIAVTLFETLVPNEIKEYAPDRRDVVLVLNELSARYPWEMMTERSRRNGDDQKPLAVQAGMVRQLQVKQFREQVVMARGHHALVIGNPNTDHYVSDLQGAELEADEVQNLLAAEGFQTESLIGAKATGNAIIKALHARDYRIIHLAGHGVFEQKEECKIPCDCCGAENMVKKVTGMVIGKKEYLTSAQLAQMRAVPELVFVNCCHLGSVDGEGKPSENDSPKLAANVATELIRMGVKAVVAAGWEVDDKAARLFATTFYKNLLEGVPFGDAVLAARKTIYDAFPTINTWGAYQCYGDHAFCLSGTDAKRAVSPRAYRFAAPVEVVTRLDNACEEAGTADHKRRAELKAQVVEIDRRIPHEWRKSGAVLAALGRAYGEFQEFEQAVGYYLEALKDERSTCSVKVVEQLANFEARWAVQITKPDRTSGKEETPEARLETARNKIRCSHGRLETLNAAIGKTAERLSLLGGTEKRLAMIEPTAAEKRKTLKQMATYYRNSYKFGGKKDPYPVTNYLSAKVLISLLDDRPLREKILRAIKQLAQEAPEGDEVRRDFWTVVAPANYQLLQYIADPESYGSISRISDHYLEIKRGYGTPRELSSVIEHLDFLMNILEVAPEQVKERFAASLADIRNKISA